MRKNLNTRIEQLKQKETTIKNALVTLKEKQAKHIGLMAIKHGLDTLDDSALENAFANIAKSQQLNPDKTLPEQHATEQVTESANPTATTA